MFVRATKLSSSVDAMSAQARRPLQLPSCLLQELLRVHLVDPEFTRVTERNERSNVIIIPLRPLVQACWIDAKRPSSSWGTASPACAEPFPVSSPQAHSQRRPERPRRYR